MVSFICFLMGIIEARLVWLFVKLVQCISLTMCISYNAYLSQCVSLTMHISHNSYLSQCVSLTMHISHNSHLSHCVSLTMHISHNSYLSQCISLTMHISHNAYLSQCISLTNCSTWINIWLILSGSLFVRLLWQTSVWDMLFLNQPSVAMPRRIPHGWRSKNNKTSAG